MAIIETFSQRQAKLRGDVPDVYVYTVPDPLRVQLFQIIHEAFGDWHTSRGTENTPARNRYTALVEVLRREYGVFVLADTSRVGSGTLGELRQHILTASAERVLDAVELACRSIEYEAKNPNTVGSQRSSAMKRTLLEVNHRFRQHGVGYEFTDGEIVRIDSELLHAEVVKPVLRLLHGPGYEGAKEEFLEAYEHYRKGDNKEAVISAIKAFESVMKSILGKRQWAHNSTDPAKRLVDALIAGGLLPNYSQHQLTGLTTLLEGVGTPRNKNAAHGQGAAPVAMSDEMTGYVLHMTASTIVFLVKAELALP